MRAPSHRLLPWLALLLSGVAAACGTATSGAPSDAEAGDMDYDIVTLLPKDAIQSIDRPAFYPVQQADAEYDPDEIVLGVAFDGQARAYSVGLLSSHEIVNDMVAGRPIAVTW